VSAAIRGFIIDQVICSGWDGWGGARVEDGLDVDVRGGSIDDLRLIPTLSKGRGFMEEESRVLTFVPGSDFCINFDDRVLGAESSSVLLDEEVEAAETGICGVVGEAGCDIPGGNIVANGERILEGTSAGDGSRDADGGDGESMMMVSLIVLSADL
jgi:hypothetical protein